MSRSPKGLVSPTGAIVIIVATVLVAVGVLIFLLWSPVKPQLEPDRFGAPGPADTTGRR